MLDHKIQFSFALLMALVASGCSADGAGDENGVGGTSTTSTADTSTAGGTDATTAPTDDTSSTGTTTGPSEGGTDTGESCDPVEFPDPGVEAAVRYELDLPDGPIPGDAVAGLTELGTAMQYEVINLAGLECAVALQRLSVHAGGVSDLSPISELTEMQILNLNFHEISDFDALSGMGELIQLGLRGNTISDISPLANMVKANEMDLAENDIVDLGPLVGVVWETTDGCGDLLLQGNPLSPATVMNDLPQICAESGIAVHVDGPESCTENSCLNP